MDNSNGDEFSWVELSALAIDVTDASESSAFRISTWGAGTEYTNTLMAKSGNVGIGTDSPDELLHLYKASGNAGLEIEAVSAGDPLIRFVSANNRTGDLYYTDATTLARFSYDHSAIAFKMYAHNNASVDFYVSETEAYFTQQNVGIGTTSPGATLHVYGSDNNVIENTVILGSTKIPSGTVGSNVTAPRNKTFLTGYSIVYTGVANAALSPCGFLEFNSAAGWTGSQRIWAITSGYDIGGVQSGAGGNKMAILVGNANGVSPNFR